jgi:hypothetical protein
MRRSRDACHATSNALEASIKTKYNGKLSSKASAMASVSNRPALVGGTPLVKPLFIYLSIYLSLSLSLSLINDYLDLMV